MTVNATITFTYGITSITLPAPAPGYSQEQRRAQTIGRTADGSVFVYDKQTVIRTLTLGLKCSQAEKDDLDAFFENTVKGALNTFTYTDHQGISHTGCRFTNPTLSWAKTPGAMWETTLTIEVPETVD